jgi:hypothetical protein
MWDGGGGGAVYVASYHAKAHENRAGAHYDVTLINKMSQGWWLHGQINENNLKMTLATAVAALSQIVL